MKQRQRIISGFLALCMVFSMLPMQVFATEKEPTVETIAAETLPEESVAETTIPAEAPTVPTEVETEPAEEGETIAPTEAATEPIEETTDPTEEYTLPTDAATEPIEETTDVDSISETEQPDSENEITESVLTTVTVHFINAAGWENVNAVIHNSSETDCEFPGVPLTENTEHKNWFDLTVMDNDGTFTCSFNNGIEQTEEIAVTFSDENTEFWYQDGVLAIEEPEIQDTISVEESEPWGIPAVMEQEPRATSPVEVSRVQWIQSLVDAFSMTVEDDNYPDNYYSDLTGNEEYYRDIMIAVEFGIIDLNAGEAFRPDEAATREFAAQTLNYALGFKLDDGVEYTFSEANSVAYPDDIQVAVNRGWFALVNGSFFPNQAITLTEQTAMLADVAIILSEDSVNEGYDSSVSVAEGVIEVPDGTAVELPAEGIAEIVDCPVNLEIDDIFVLFYNGLPVVGKVLDITVYGNTTFVTYTQDGTESAITSIDYEGSVEANLENFEGTDATTFTVGDQTVYMGITTFGIDYDNNKKVLTASKTVSLGDGVDATISAKISSLKFDLKVKSGEYRCVMSGNATLSTNVSLDLMDALKAAKTVELGRVYIGGVGYVKLSVEFSLAGELTLTWNGDVEAGFTYSTGNGLRVVRSFNKKQFTFMAEVTLKSGLRLDAGVDVLLIKANIWAKIGAQMDVNVTAYSTGKPSRCLDMEGFMYASVGVNGSIIGIYEFSKSYDIYTRSNSPIRAHYHYEDEVWVSACTVGTAADGSGSTSSDYYTDPGSSNFNPGTSSGSSSYTGASGETIVVYTYTLDNENNATITGYNGGASALYIPSTIDGYPVTAIGSGAFEGNTLLYSVRIADSVTDIGSSAFEDCINLSVVTLSDNLTTLGCGAFQNCIGLTSINIPMNMNTGAYCGSNWVYPGPFDGCVSLNDISFEEGITYLPDALFSGASGLTSIDLPDTITTLNWKVFENCVNLSSISLPESISHIGSKAFVGCTALTEVTLPASIVELGCGAFQNCTNLKAINIPKDMNTGEYCGNSAYPGPFAGCEKLNEISFEEGITYLPDGLFSDCSGLTSITIPDTVTELRWKAFQNCENLIDVTLSKNLTSIASSCFAGSKKLIQIDLPRSLQVLGCGAFQNCTALAKVFIPKNMNTGEYCGNSAYPGPFNGCSSLTEVIFEEGISRIPNALFAECTGLEELTIPETITELNWVAFRGCSSLKSIYLPDGLTGIATKCFSDCISLQNIQIPDSVTSIGSAAFSGCSDLVTAKLPVTTSTVVEALFQDCISLTEIQLPDTVTAIYSNAFSGCIALEEIIFPDELLTIGASAFKNCDNLTSVTLPSKLTSLGKESFYDCDKLESFNMSNSVSSIGSSIFNHCDMLKYVTLSSNLTTIPDSAFQQCSLLEEITIPYYITSIGKNAFNSSPKLAKVILPRNLNSIGTGAFSYANTTVIYGVPGTYAETWATDNEFQFIAHEVPATEVVINHSRLTLNKGASQTLFVTVTPGDFTDNITWKSSDTNVVTVTDKGVIKGVSIGTATIKVTVGDVSASCNVTVVQPVTSISLNKTSLTMEAGETYKLSASVKPSDAVNKEISWTTSDPVVASISADGLVTAIGKGTATITAAAQDGSGITKTCTVTVSNNLYTAEKIEELESTHPYENSCKDVWVYSIENAKAITLTFDNKTELESGFDYLYIYDTEGNLVGKYTGADLAGQTLKISGNTVKIQMSTDAGGTAWGFKVTDIQQVNEEHVHDYGDWIQSIAPTCTEKGEKIRSCACGDIEKEVIAAIGHTETILVSKAATCTATGLTEGKYCSVCNAVLVEQETLSALGHKWTAADCDTPKTCSVCKATEGKALGHSYDDNVDGTCNSCGVNRETVEVRQVTHMLRMYNPYTGEHFYTGSEEERDNLVAVGWNYEGVAFTFPGNTGAPVYRLYDPATGEHLYTMDEEEKAALMAKGWNYEGIAFNSAYDTEAVQHRLHNPYATVGAYHFTFSDEEKQNLINAGWEYQGIGWYSCWK